MATNHYFNQKVSSEQQLYEDIIVESLKFYGQDVYYLPRDIVREDTILGDDVPSKFNSAYIVEMYPENVMGFDGEGDLYTKFGVEIRDAATFVLARRRWSQTVARLDNEISSVRPREGDLIYLPMSKSLFEIMHVEHEDPFYQLRNLPVYKLRCELFEYNDEQFDTNIAGIDEIEKDFAYRWNITTDSAGAGYTVGETVTQTLSSGIVISGEVVRWADSDATMWVAHVGGDDSAGNGYNFHEFTTGINIVGGTSGTSINVATVTETNTISANEDNSAFETSATDMDFLDFSEDNPFGDPR